MDFSKIKTHEELQEAQKALNARADEIKESEERKAIEEELKKLEYAFKRHESCPQTEQVRYVFLKVGLSQKQAGHIVDIYHIFASDPDIDRFCLDYRIPKRKVLEAMAWIEQLCDEGLKHSEEVRKREKKRYSKKGELSQEDKDLLKV